MKFNKAALVSALGLSVIHFILVLIATKFRPGVLDSGTPGSVTDTVEAVITQPGMWVADFMGCIPDRPMWWVFLVLNSALWGNVIAFAIRKLSGKSGGVTSAQ